MGLESNYWVTPSQLTKTSATSKYHYFVLRLSIAHFLLKTTWLEAWDLRKLKIFANRGTLIYTVSWPNDLTLFFYCGLWNLQNLLKNGIREVLYDVNKNYICFTCLKDSWKSIPFLGDPFQRRILKNKKMKNISLLRYHSTFVVCYTTLSVINIQGKCRK